MRTPYQILTFIDASFSCFSAKFTSILIILHKSYHFTCALAFEERGRMRVRVFTCMHVCVISARTCHQDVRVVSPPLVILFNISRSSLCLNMLVYHCVVSESLSQSSDLPISRCHHKLQGNGRRAAPKLPNNKQTATMISHPQISECLCRYLSKYIQKRLL